MRSFQVLPGAGAGASGTSEEELPRNAQGLGSGASRCLRGKTLGPQEDVLGPLNR